MDQNNLWPGFQMPRRLAADSETLTERYGRFSAQPFERGFGTTVGNSLRRALLSSIEGAVITAVKIEGVEQEFSFFFFQAEDGIRDRNVTGVQTCALPISFWLSRAGAGGDWPESFRGRFGRRGH